MSSLERKNHRFSEEEKKEIAEVAIDLANAGEEAVWDVLIIKNTLALQTIDILQGNSNNSKALKTAKILEHEVNVMNEVIRRARAILKMEGRDSQSRLEEERLKASFGYFGDQAGDSE